MFNSRFVFNKDTAGTFLSLLWKIQLKYAAGVGLSLTANQSSLPVFWWEYFKRFYFSYFFVNMHGCFIKYCFEYFCIDIPTSLQCQDVSFASWPSVSIKTPWQIRKFHFGCAVETPGQRHCDVTVRSDLLGPFSVIVVICSEMGIHIVLGQLGTCWEKYVAKYPGLVTKAENNQFMRE